MTNGMKLVSNGDDSVSECTIDECVQFIRGFGYVSVGSDGLGFYESGFYCELWEKKEFIFPN